MGSRDFGRRLRKKLGRKKLPQPPSKGWSCKKRGKKKLGGWGTRFGGCVKNFIFHPPPLQGMKLPPPHPYGENSPLKTTDTTCSFPKGTVWLNGSLSVSCQSILKLPDLPGLYTPPPPDTVHPRPRPYIFIASLSWATGFHLIAKKREVFFFIFYYLFFFLFSLSLSLPSLSHRVMYFFHPSLFLQTRLILSGWIFFLSQGNVL